MIIGLKAENFKVLEAVDVQFANGTTIVTGKNGSGKSSLLEALWAALGGNRATSKPVRKGADKAVIEAEVSDGENTYIVRKRILPSGERLEIFAADGQPMRSPQAVLDRLLGALTFDPVEFLRLKPAQQVEVLRKVSGVDTSEDEAAVNRIFTQRTETGREIKALEAVITDLIPGEVTNAEQIEARILEVGKAISKVEEKEDKLKALQRIAESHDRQVEQVKAARDGLSKRIIALEQELAEARAAMQSESERVLQVTADAKESKAEYEKAMADPILLTKSSLNKELVELHRASERAKQSQRLNGKRKELESLRSLHVIQTEQIDAIRGVIKEKVLSARYPIDGLSIEDGVIVYRGNDLNTCSQAEQIVVAASIGAATIPDPGIRTLLIRDGSLLDGDSWAALIDAMERQNMQLIAEVVGDTPESGIRIVQGHQGAVLHMDKGSVAKGSDEPLGW